MSVLAARPCTLREEFSSSESSGAEDGVDWGTATPRNTISLIQLDGKLEIERDMSTIEKRGECQLPTQQRALLLHGIRERFVLTERHAVPETREPNELVVKIQAIGLNPVDWKSVDYGFGIPQLPYVAGRDFAGTVVKAPSTDSHIQVGDVVLCGSTDYRDVRKAAYQQYAIATPSTVCRVPPNVSITQAAALGVAFVAATLTLGVCLGLKLPKKGPDLRHIVRSMSLESLPADAVPECMSIEEHERPRPGDWLVIWGGSSTSALFLSQIALLAGLKVILVVDLAKHGSKLAVQHECIIVDSHNAERAVEMIRGITANTLRFAVDTVGKDTTIQLAKCLRRDDKKRSHLVGLAALPKEREESVVYHSVPVKLFHKVPEVGSSLMAWLEEALMSSTLHLPRVTEAGGGLEGINDALDMMRKGRISGQRLVVPLS